MSYFTIFYPLQVHLYLLNSIKVKKKYALIEIIMIYTLQV